METLLTFVHNAAIALLSLVVGAYLIALFAESVLSSISEFIDDLKC